MNDGDDRALGHLYDAYAESLYDYALSVTADSRAAADIVHDTFIDAARRAPRMRDHLHLRAWLYGAARRRALRRGRADVAYWDPDGEFSPLPALDRTETPPPPELRTLLHGAMARLAPVDQEVLLLVTRHGLRPAELGVVLGVSPRRAAALAAQTHALLGDALAEELARVAASCAADHTAPKTEPTPEAAPDLVTAKPTGLSRRAVAVLTARRSTNRAPDAGPHPFAPPGPASHTPSAGSHSSTTGPQAPTQDSAGPADRGAATGGGGLGNARLERHRDGCDACRRRGRVQAAALLVLPPAPVLPAALRHRVMHTAADPELADHRADIVARGGKLTPEGMPVQPDVPSPYTRRWLFAGGGMAGALAAALLAVMVMGPPPGTPTLLWPPGAKPRPTISNPPSPDALVPSGGDPRAPGQSGRHGAAPPLDPQLNTTPSPPKPGQTTPPAPTRPGISPPPGYSLPEQSPSPSPRPGMLQVAPAKVTLVWNKPGRLTLTAASGPVDWKVTSSTDQLQVSQTAGGLAENSSGAVTVQLRTTLLNPAGSGTLTFTDETGAEHQVTVEWGASLL
ncbi:RNA polymerase sigma factor [Actinomadura hibisca]|uniref:RNA polymerase sigma factor n=1 Tax=Actinomadura hibisca TaxID=68565 RepID=UPI0014720BF1|nr:RNA polymerase sigma factor [Actinomadura hibisca]